MSDQDKKRWQQHIPHVVGGEKCQAWVRTVWREIESRDNESRAEDLMQLLQEIYRERKKDPARSWEDIEATIKKNAAKSRRRKDEISVFSEEALSIEDQIALFHQWRAETERGSDE